MSKFIPIELSKVEDKIGFSFQCPGCGCAHYIQTNAMFKPCWYFNNDIDKPTVSPSILVHQVNGGVCHSFITDGKIKYLDDCTHDLKGQTVALQEFY